MRVYLLWLLTTALGLSGGLLAALLVLSLGDALLPAPSPSGSSHPVAAAAAYLAWVAVALAASWVGWRRFVRPRRR